MLDLYRRWLSPLLHSVSGVSGACRFQPTCSEYAFVALSRHGVLSGAALALWRVLRCNPFAQGGLDPVPDTCRPPSFPDFRCSLVASLKWMRHSLVRLSLMRLSLKNGAHAFLCRAAHRKLGFPHR